MAIDTSGYITVAEAAKRIGLSEEQVRRKLRAGKLTGRRIGQQWFVDEGRLAKRGARRPSEPLLSDEFVASVHKLRQEIEENNLAQGNPPIDVLELIRQHREEA